MKKFYSWLSGFIDGEGMFGVYYNCSHAPILMFKISLRTDDCDILEEIKERLGTGCVYHNVSNGDSNPQSYYTIRKVKDLWEVLIPILDQYQLKTRKRADYEIFREVVEHQYQTYRKRKTKEYKDVIFSLASLLKESKQYV